MKPLTDSDIAKIDAWRAKPNPLSWRDIGMNIGRCRELCRADYNERHGIETVRKVMVQDDSPRVVSPSPIRLAREYNEPVNVWKRKMGVA
jgi:hypothetical protein